MHFDQREQAALREAGLSTDEIRAVADHVADATATEAERLRSFFDRETVHSDMDLAHSSGDVHDHEVRFVDLFTHSEEIRGYLRFSTWGAWVADGRVLRPAAPGETDPEAAGEPEVVELTFGPTLQSRVRFAADPEDL
jgi:hypothetical protein